MKLLFLFFAIVININSFSLTIDYKIDSLNTILNDKIADSTEVNIFIQLSELYLKNDLKAAISYANKAEEKAIACHLKNKLPEIYRLIGRCYYHLGEYGFSLNYYKHALSLSEKYNDKPTIAATLNNLGVIYANTDNPDKSVDYFKSALLIFEEIGDSSQAGTVCMNISSVYAEIEKYDKALLFLDKFSLFYSETNPDLWVKVKMLGSMATIHSQMGDYELALSYGKEAVDKANKTNNIILLGEMQLTLSEVYYRSNDFDNSILHADSILYYAKQSKAKQQLQNGYKLLTDSYEKKGNTDLAYKYYKLYVSHRDSILIEEQKIQIIATEIKHELFEKEQKITILEKDNKVLKQKETIEKQKKITLISGIILILLITIGAYFLYKTRLKKAVLEKSVLKEKLDFTHKELTNYALHIIQKNNMLTSMKKDLQNLKQNNSEDERTKISQILIMKLRNELGLEKDRILFNKQLELLGDEFLIKLNTLFPNLTPNEKQMATLLRLKLTSKEIASILNISHNSVNVNRYRFRKKLKLTTKEDLVTFLNSI